MSNLEGFLEQGISILILELFDAALNKVEVLLKVILRQHLPVGTDYALGEHPLYEVFSFEIIFRFHLYFHASYEEAEVCVAVVKITERVIAFAQKLNYFIMLVWIVLK